MTKKQFSMEDIYETTNEQYLLYSKLKFIFGHLDEKRGSQFLLRKSAWIINIL